MKLSKRKKQNDRIEIRLSQELKESKAIVESQQSILVSQKDKEIFFNALMGIEEAPDQALLSAIKYHKDLIAP